jgi:hypothetical protein
MKTINTGFIVVTFATVLLGSCYSRRSDDGSTISTAPQSASQTSNENEGMDLVHRGLALVKSGKDLVNRGQLAGNRTTVNQGLGVIDQGLAVVSAGKELMEKDRVTMDGEHSDGEHMTDDMNRIHQGMGIMSQGKEMAGKGMGPMGQNSASESGTMDKSMMAQGMAMMEKGLAMTEQCCGGKMKKDPIKNDSSGKAPMPTQAMGDDKPMPKDTSMQDDM